MDEILRVVSEMTDISIDEIKSRSRKREICEARQIFIYICHKDRGKTIVAISEYLGRKRSGITFQYQTFDQQLRIYRLLKKKVDEIRDVVIHV